MVEDQNQETSLLSNVQDSRGFPLPVTNLPRLWYLVPLCKVASEAQACQQQADFSEIHASLYKKEQSECVSNPIDPHMVSTCRAHTIGIQNKLPITGYCLCSYMGMFTLV